MTVHPRNLDSLESLLESLRPVRLRLLTSIENEASIEEFVDGVRTTLNLEDLALYFVNPEKQKLGTGSRSGTRTTRWGDHSPGRNPRRSPRRSHAAYSRASQRSARRRS